MYTYFFNSHYSVYVHVDTCACMCTFTYGAKTVLSTQQTSALLQAQKPNHHSQQSAWRINQTQLTSATYVDFVHVYMFICAYVCVSTCTHVKPGINVRDLPRLYSTLCLSINLELTNLATLAGK